MDVTTTQSALTTAATSAITEESSSVLTSDFETFLLMLTTQAEYQDPLEPIDSSEYAAQLAQFSMVEQQVQSNELLQALMTQMSASSMGQIAGWIGMEARTTAAVAFDGSPLTVTPVIEAGADQAFLIAYDEQGNEVDRKNIGTTGEPIEWSGIKSDGSYVDDGRYTFSVESLSAGQSIGVSAAQAYARITEARTEGSETVFVLDGGSTVTAAEIAALREPV